MPIDPMQNQKPQQSNIGLIKNDLAPVVKPIYNAFRGTAGPNYHDGGEANPNLNRRMDRFMGWGPYAKPAQPAAPVGVQGPAAPPSKPGVQAPAASVPSIPAAAASQPKPTGILNYMAKNTMSAVGGAASSYANWLQRQTTPSASPKPVAAPPKPTAPVMTAAAPKPTNQAASTEPVAHPQATAAPIGTTFAVAPDSGRAGAINAFHDGQGYGPGLKAVASQGQPGVKVEPTSATSVQTPHDPFRAQLEENARMAAAAARNSKQQFFYPPGTGVDPVFAPNLRNDQAQEAAQSLNHYDLNKAMVAEKDPNKQIAMLQQIARDKQLRGVYLAGRGADPATIASLDQPGEGARPLNGTNYESAGMANPATADAAAFLNGSAPFHEKAAMFAGMPGINNPGDPHRNLFDAYMASRNSTGQDFANELASYGVGGNTGYDLGSPVSALGSIFGAAKEGIFGADPSIAARNRQLQEHMAQLGYGPAAIGSGPIGVKPQGY